MPELVVSHPDGQVERFPLTHQDVVVGRDTMLTVSLPDSKVSRRHARIFLRRDTWFIEDLQSVNGVLHNGTRITAPTAMSPGVAYQIGDAKVHLAVPPGPKAVAPQAPQPAGGTPSKSPAVTWRIDVQGGKLSGVQVPLAGRDWLMLGRDHDAQVPLEDPSVSRRHARLRPGNSGVEVEDLKSSNGTALNDVPTTTGHARDGDALRFGSVVVRLVRLGGQEAAAPAPLGAAPNSRPNLFARLRGGPTGRRLLAAMVALLVLMAFAGAGLAARRWWRHRHARAKITAPKGGRSHPTAIEETSTPDGGKASAPLQATSEPNAHDPTDRPIAVADDPHIATPPPRTETQTALAATPASGASEPTSIWRTLRGMGPVPAEAQRDRAIEALYARALAQAKAADRDGAQHTLGELLAQDALHPQARSLAAELTINQLQLEALRRAQTHLHEGQALEALAVVSQALDLPYPAPILPAQLSTLVGALPQELTELADQAARVLGQACGERAQAACMAQAWEPCITQVACLLGYAPRSTQGQALLALAQDALGPQSDAPQATEGAPSDAASAAATTAAQAAAKLAAIYPQPALRQAVLVYATGDIGAAQMRMRPLLCAQCRAAANDVRQVALGLPRAKQLRESGQAPAACDVYDEVLAADARLAPSPTPSVLRALAVAGKQAALLQIGETAFARGAYPEAQAAWGLGLALAPEHEGLKLATSRLRHRAQDLWDALVAQRGKNPGPLSADACERLRQVLEMTDPDSPLHAQAQSIAGGCKGKHGRLTPAP